jgi:hypothetical protein
VQTVEPFGGLALEKAIGGAVGALGEHDVKALPPDLEHVDDQLRRILQVGIDGNDGLAAGVFDAAGQRGFLAEVA